MSNHFLDCKYPDVTSSQASLFAITQLERVSRSKSKIWHLFERTTHESLELQVFWDLKILVTP